MHSVDPAHEGGLPPLGTMKELVKILSRFNTAPDGASSSAMGVARLYGPGMVMDAPASGDEILQLMVTMTDDDFAFPVLMRLCREQKWTLLDPETGQRLRFGA